MNHATAPLEAISEVLARDDEERFLDSIAKDCRCHTGVICGGVQAGGFCDELGRDPDREDEPAFEDDCGCEWDASCQGYGFFQCRGCGGDQCVCVCGGEMDCFGCADCRDPVEDLETA